ncbi:unnamed protein product, partial [marine sediment metagenome]
DENGEEKIGIIVRPNLEAVSGATTLGELYEAIKHDIDEALSGGPSYLKQYDFCLTAWQADGYAELVKSTMGDPCPLRNPFTPEAAYSRMKASGKPVPW